jgi:hypothetical protein
VLDFSERYESVMNGELLETVVSKVVYKSGVHADRTPGAAGLPTLVHSNLELIIEPACFLSQFLVSSSFLPRFLIASHGDDHSSVLRRGRLSPCLPRFTPASAT